MNVGSVRVGATLDGKLAAKAEGENWRAGVKVGTGGEVEAGFQMEFKF